MKKRKQKVTPFEEYFESLPEAEAEKLSEFFVHLDQHLMLPKNCSRNIREDFEKAFLYFTSTGVSVDAAIKRLNTENLGGFYARPPVRWYPLDDSAKIYPMSMKHNQMAVFRLSVYLKEQVVPELLQVALSFTIKRFPSFATTVKKGFFWHYLDTTKRRFSVEKENKLPCAPLKMYLSGSQSFRVIYFQNRISVEFFHSLTDGSGALVFLKTLTAQYLKLTGVEIPPTEGILNINDIPQESETSNDFPIGEPTYRATGFINKAAVQMSGKLSRIKPSRVLHFRLNAKELKSVAKSKNSTITAYVLALLFLAGKYATEESKGTMSIQVPVNMRKFFDSITLRNFSLYAIIQMDLSEISTLEEILPKLSSQLAEKADVDEMKKMMNATVGMVHGLRYVPLFIKGPVARMVYGFLGDGILSNTLSNLGVIKLPPEMIKHVEKFDFVLGPGITNRADCAMVTFENITTLSVTKATADPSFEEKLYRLLEEDGLHPVVEGSYLYES